MSAPVSIRVAVIDGRAWWKCTNCGVTIGEFTGQYLLVKGGDRTILIRLPADIRQPCHRCGVDNVLTLSDRSPNAHAMIPA